MAKIEISDLRDKLEKIKDTLHDLSERISKIYDLEVSVTLRDAEELGGAIELLYEAQKHISTAHDRIESAINNLEVIR